jgi:hypothetical protein
MSHRALHCPSLWPLPVQPCLVPFPFSSCRCVRSWQLCWCLSPMPKQAQYVSVKVCNSRLWCLFELWWAHITTTVLYMLCLCFHPPPHCSIHLTCPLGRTNYSCHWCKTYWNPLEYFNIFILDNQSIILSEKAEYRQSWLKHQPKCHVYLCGHGQEDTDYQYFASQPFVFIGLSQWCKVHK